MLKTVEIFANNYWIHMGRKDSSKKKKRNRNTLAKRILLTNKLSCFLIWLNGNHKKEAVFTKKYN